MCQEPGLGCDHLAAPPNLCVFVSDPLGSCGVDGTIRLADGTDSNEGRVEICSDGVWGTVYRDSTWDSREGVVVCKQLGFQNPSTSYVAKVHSLSNFILFFIRSVYL